MKTTTMLAALVFGGFALSRGLAADAAPTPPSQAELLATLTSSASLGEKWVAAQRLAQIGTGEAVPKLAALLGDEQLADLARSALEAIPDPAVDAALRQALDRLKGRDLAGVITSIGARRDAQAVEPLSRFLRGSEPALALAAAAALGRIGTPQAARALEAALPSAPAGLQGELCADLVQCADTLQAAGDRAEAASIYQQVGASQAPAPVRAAAVRGAILAGDPNGLKLLTRQLESDDRAVFAAVLGMIQQDLPGAEVSEALAGELAKLPAARQVPLIQAMGVRGDEAAGRALGKAARAGEVAPRLAALRAMAGNASFEPLLSEMAGDDDRAVAAAAQEGLVSVPGPEADSAVLAMLDSQSASRRLAGVQMAGRRRLRAALPKLLKIAGASDSALSRAALSALGDLAGDAEVPALAGLLSGADGALDLASVEQALARACARAKSPEVCSEHLIGQLTGANPACRCLLLRVLGGVGGGKALRAVRAAVSDADGDTRRAAIHTLAQWHNAQAAPDLLELARTLPERAERLVCLRGYLGMARNEELPPPQRLAMCRQALALSEEPEQRKLLLSALGGIASAESLALVVPALDNPATAKEAGAAILAVAGALLEGPQAAASVPAIIDPLYQVTQADPASALAGQAKATLKQAFQVQGPRGSGTGPVRFVMHRIGNFRSEACGVADFNGDGKLDVVAGE